MQLTNIKGFQTMPTVHSTDVEWKNWYGLLKRKYGKQAAATLFLKVWAKQGNSNANTVSLRETLSKDGINLDAGFLGNMADIGSDFIDSIEEATKMGKIFIYSLGGIILLGTAVLVFSIARRPGETIGTALKVAAV